MSDLTEQLDERIDHLKAGLVAITRGDTTDLSETEFRETRKVFV